MTAGHLQELERVRVDVAVSVIDRLKIRDDAIDSEEIVWID